MKKLYMHFLNEDGKRTTLSPKLVSQTLPPEKVKEFMELIIDLDVFEVKGRKKYVEIVSAKYVETITTDLFKV